MPDGGWRPNPSSVNEGMTHLDLTGSIGRSLALRELSDLLFPRHRHRPPHLKLVPTADGKLSDEPPLQESWEDDSGGDAAPEPPPPALNARHVPLPLLPNLTHLSLALMPDRPATAAAVS